MLRLAIALLFATSVLLFGQIQGGKRVGVAFWAKTNLQQFGGPNVDIVICGRNLGVVEYVVVDNDHVVVTTAPDTDPHSPGESHAAFSPVITRKSIHLGQDVHLTGIQGEAYLLYETVGGPSVYFLDALDNKQNECALLIVRKSKPQN